MGMSPWQQLANSSPGSVKAPARKPKPRPKPAARRPVSTASVAPAYRPAAVAHSHGGGGGGGVPMPPGMGGGPAPMAASGQSLLAQLSKQASEMVGMELDPQIRSRQFARQEATRNYQSQVAELKKRLGLTKQEITQLYGAADVLLQDNARKQQAAYGKAQESTTGAYDQLEQMLGGNYGQAGQQVSGELARLGQSSPDATARLQADQAFSEGQAGAGRANATSTIDAIKAAAGSEAAQLRGATAATAPLLIGQAQMKADDTMAAGKRELDSTVRQLTFQINELTGSRKAKTAAALRELQAAQAQAEQDAQQLQFMNSIRAAQVGISQGQLDLARTRLGYDVQNQQASLVLRAKQLQEQLNKANGPKTGMEKAYTYLGTGYKGKVPQGQLQQLLEDAINGNSNDPGWQPGQGVPGYDPKYLDAYKRDITNAVKQRGWSAAELNALLNAANYYFGR